MTLSASIYAEDIQTSEHLDRALVAVTGTSGNLVQWRKLVDDDAKGISYSLDCYSSSGSCTTIEIASGKASCYLDAAKSARYTLHVKDAEGNVLEEQTMTDVTPFNKGLKQIKLNRPAGGSTQSGSYSYTPNDCSVGDVDGDGAYEIIVKWDPSNSQDNSKSGHTGNTIFDCYEITGDSVGQHKWRIDLGVNVRAGAHYSPFLVYDFDGDGKAEFVVKTAPGSKDGKGNYVTNAGSTELIRNCTANGTDYRNSNGHILKGEEFLTIFSGETGEALRTVWYWPNHARSAAGGTASTSYSWDGDSYGNRGHRYNACVAYLDGLDHKPSIVMQRGYYTQAYFWAVDWDGTNLTTRWLHRGTSKTAWSVLGADAKQKFSGSGKSSYGQGVHGISVGDVDGDGFDEIVMGSATIDHDGKLLCSTGFGHGDAIHLGKLMPDREGLQVYMPHEESGCGYGDDMHDPATGEILYRGYTSGDNGRGLACDMFYQVDATTGVDLYRGYELWSGAMSQPMNAVTGMTVGSKPDTNFRIYWNGDLYDESLDGRFSTSTNGCSPRIIYWDGSANKTINVSTFGGSPQSCNYTKATPCLTADIWGDWREEMIFWDSSDNATLDIYTTSQATTYPVPCLMTDHVYRMGVAWQNSSYNQPPHLGYYLPDAYMPSYEVVQGAINDTLYTNQEITPIIFKLRNIDSAKRTGPIAGLDYVFDEEAQTFTVKGTPTKTGSFSTTYSFTGNNSTIKATGKLVVVEGTSAIDVIEQDASADAPRYDLQGRKVKEATPGLYTQNQKVVIVK